MNNALFVNDRPRDGKRKAPGSQSHFLRMLGIHLLERLAFFQAFVREPARIGAFSPSSLALAKAMVEGFSLSSADTVVELGPGTGAFTRLIRERIGKGTTFFALELDSSNARTLQRRFPDVFVYNDAAERIPEYLALHGKRKADYIVCGLPWASLPLAVQDRTLDGITSSLAPGGVFSTFAYVAVRWLPKAKRFRQRIRSSFAHIETSPLIWRNLPPALVYRCRS